MRFEIVKIAHRRHRGNAKRHHGSERPHKDGVPSERGDHAAAHNRCQSRPEGDHATAYGKIGGKPVLRCNGKHGIHHQRNENAASHRLHHASQHENGKIACEQANGRTRQSQSRRHKKQRAQLDAAVHERHAHHRDGRNDHIASDRPLRQHRIYAEIRHDRHERHVHEILVETAQKRTAIEHHQQWNQRLILLHGMKTLSLAQSPARNAQSIRGAENAVMRVSIVSGPGKLARKKWKGALHRFQNWQMSQLQRRQSTRIASRLKARSPKFDW